MLTSQRLRASVLHSLRHPSFQTSLRGAARHYPALAVFDDGASLAAFLETERTYSPRRDGVLADLIRWYRDSGDAAPMAAATCAMLPAVVRSARELAGGECAGQSDALCEVMSVVPVAISSFDPDKRSPHVLAGLRADVRKVLRQNAKRARRQALGEAEDVSATALDGDTDAGLWAEIPASDANAAGILDESDIEPVTTILREFEVTRGLSRRDALLIEGLLLRGITATELGAVHGMDRTTVKRHVHRALERIGDALRRRILGADASNSARSGFLDGFPE